MAARHDHQTFVGVVVEPRLGERGARSLDKERDRTELVQGKEARMFRTGLAGQRRLQLQLVAQVRFKLFATCGRARQRVWLLPPEEGGEILERGPSIEDFDHRRVRQSGQVESIADAPALNGREQLLAQGRVQFTENEVVCCGDADLLPGLAEISVVSARQLLRVQVIENGLL